jgi:hypothetical protein
MGARKRLRAEKLKADKKNNCNSTIEKVTNFTKKNEIGSRFNPWY